VTQVEDVVTLADFARTMHGSLDVFVNNLYFNLLVRPDTRLGRTLQEGMADGRIRLHLCAAG
jgi:hypothetical protein